MAHDGDIDDRGKLLCRKEAARYLTALGLVIAPQTLARKYHEGTGPLCTHVGVRAMYWQAHLDAYFKAQVSDAAAGSPASRKRVKTSSADRAPMSHAPKEEDPAHIATPPLRRAPQSDNFAPVSVAAAPPPGAKPLAPASATPSKRKKRVDAALLNQQELPF